MIDEKRTIIFFDGVCHLCNGFVDWMIQRDLEHQFYFAPLQGTTARGILPVAFQGKLETVLLLKDGQVLTASEAVLTCFSILAWPYRAFVIFKCIPAFLRDPLYYWIAKNRYRWWGQRESCRLPGPKEGPYLLP